jgi:hypothetical protein
MKIIIYNEFNHNFMSKLAEEIIFILVLVFALWFVKTAIVLIPEILKFP